MIQAPGFELLTRSVPGEATNGVAIEAMATVEPERSCTVTYQPLRSLPGRSRSAPKDESQLLEVVGSDDRELKENKFKYLRLSFLEDK